MFLFNKLNSNWLNVNISDLLLEASKKYKSNIPYKLIKGIIVPHAGYKYSGLCAASGYLSCMKNAQTPNLDIKNIIILGTMHRCNLDNCNSIIKPELIDNNLLDAELLQQLNFQIDIDNKTFKNEHSIEIQIPFIKKCFPNAKITPLLIGNLNNFNLNEFNKLDQFKNLSDNILFIISGDLNHINGNFNYNLSNYEVKMHNFKAISMILNPTNQSLQNMKNYEKHTICGWNTFKYWCNIAIFKNLKGSLLCYYTSLDNDIYETDTVDEFESSVSYCAIAFFNKNYNNSKSQYDLLNIDIVPEIAKIFTYLISIGLIVSFF